ncbi:MAG: Gfo/Idh/MocA family oxidoreductase [Planctomycetes bacterium]|nr:Gfo/Idh/MocA family oxidoreductase [Planctomycetota bacterium]
MTEKVKVGVIGLGFMGTTHLELYRKSGKAEICAVADARADRLGGDISSVAGNIQGEKNERLDLSGVRTYRDGMDLIADPEVELVDICLPVHLHKVFALAAIAANKHVLCEKPLAMSSADAAEILAAAAQNEKCFMTGLCVRFWPEYRWAREQLQAGALGEVRQAFFKRFSPTVQGMGADDWFADDSKSGGALLEMHLHDTDQVRWLFGRPERVTSSGCRGLRSKDCWDHVFTFYDFANGSLIVAEGGWTAAKGTPFEMSFQLIGTRATVIFGPAGLWIYHEDGRSEQVDLSGEPFPTGWEAELHALLDAIREGRKTDLLIAPQEVVDGLAIIEAERKSAESGLPVKVVYDRRGA